MKWVCVEIVEVDVYWVDSFDDLVLCIEVIIGFVDDMVVDDLYWSVVWWGYLDVLWNVICEVCCSDFIMMIVGIVIWLVVEEDVGDGFFWVVIDDCDVVMVLIVYGVKGLEWLLVIIFDMV